MLIRVLPALDCRAHWIDFCRRDSSYCFIESPQALVEFQTSYLQITHLAGAHLDGRQAVKYSLGARYSVEPAWALIRACDWKLTTILAGLEQLDFSGNVRDNSLLGVHTDLTVRKFFAKDRRLGSPSRLGLLEPLDCTPSIWNADALARLLANGQWRDLIGESNADVDADALLLQLLDGPAAWLGLEHSGRLYLLHRRRPLASLIPDYRMPEPRLKSS
ncbi:hypothetical protein GCM10011348_40650 [Marinobacterium nitratireducens]|uniref:Uncharacterized protein n=1 Tax=Marinobacterium nitratireducens TaxID=518897 RepID=A0A918DXM9_9GAMM|nr:hypothetical protein [Marinobacterium nitratireducens]GGO87444.1 hypothetical protein GCM10011348_40650 [Marinobacterium nitratireducens]